MKPALTLCLAMVLGLSACGDLKLRKMNSDDKGPEEFTVLPVKPLQEPSDYKVLPEPNSAAGNLVDATPKADAIVALGGTPVIGASTKVPAADSSLVRHTSRFGTTPDIRDVLAVEDAEIRKSRSRMLRFQLNQKDLYSKVYEKQILDAHAEIAKFRAAGVLTPAVPPK
jgi:hypothetical protein